MEIVEFKRVFKYKDTILDDPGEQLSPREAMKFYANSFPELASANCKGPEYEGDKQIYEFTTEYHGKG